MATKKGVGDIMNQLGIISDLLEKINLETENVKVDIDLKLPLSNPLLLSDVEDFFNLRYWLSCTA